MSKTIGCFIRHKKQIKKNINVLVSIATIIISIILVLFYVDTVYIKTKSEIGFCPQVFSGSFCNTNDSYVCGDIEEISYSCENSGDLRIETEIYNKGLVLAIDTELEVKLIGAEFGVFLTGGRFPMTIGFVDYYLDDEISSSRISKRNNLFFLSQSIHVLNPNDFRRVAFVFPRTFGIYKRPDVVEFTLKSNGEIIDKKTVFMEYEDKERGECEAHPTTPYPISGKVISNGKTVTDVKIIIKNLQTGEEQNTLSNIFGDYIMDMSNFKKCWIDGDIIEIKTCVEEKCQIKGYEDLRTFDTAIEFNIFL